MTKGPISYSAEESSSASNSTFIELQEKTARDVSSGCEVAAS